MTDTSETKFVTYEPGRTYRPDSVAGQRLREIRERRAQVMLDQNGDKAFGLTTNADVVVLMALQYLRSGATADSVARLLGEYVSAQERRGGTRGE